MKLDDPTHTLTPISDPEFFEGRVLNDSFRLKNQIGRGGMGSVYQAEQLSIGRDVAVKLIRPDPNVPGTLEARFLREAKIMSQFSHPNIVQLIDFGRTDDGILYLAMEFVNGHTVADLLVRGRFAPELATEILRQTCLGLTEAHGHGVIHRDLKASNLVLSVDHSGLLRVRILDFGIAYPRDQDVKITQSGLLCGTPSYLAPEQARAQPLDHRADLYSMGIAYFYMLTGSLPFHGDALQILFKHVQEPPPDIAKMLDADPGIVDLVESLLCKDPDDRPGKAVDVVRTIEQLGMPLPAIGQDDTPFDALILPQLDPTRTPPTTRIAINTTTEGSTPFTEADDEVKGAWEAFLEQDNEVEQGAFDPNLDGLTESDEFTKPDGLEMPEYSAPASRSSNLGAFEDRVDRVTEFEVTDAIREAPLPVTGRISAIKTAAPPAESQAPSTIEKPETPEVPQPAPKRAKTVASADSRAPEPEDDTSRPLWHLLVGFVVLGLMAMTIVYALSRPQFAPEPDTMTDEEWRAYKEQVLEQAAQDKADSEPTPNRAPKKKKPGARRPKKKKKKKGPIDLWPQKTDGASKGSNDDPFGLESKP